MGGGNADTSNTHALAPLIVAAAQRDARHHAAQCRRRAKEGCTAANLRLASSGLSNEGAILLQPILFSCGASGQAGRRVHVGGSARGMVTLHLDILPQAKVPPLRAACVRARHTGGHPLTPVACGASSGGAHGRCTTRRARSGSRIRRATPFEGNFLWNRTGRRWCGIVLTSYGVPFLPASVSSTSRRARPWQGASGSQCVRELRARECIARHRLERNVLEADGSLAFGASAVKPIDEDRPQHLLVREFRTLGSENDF